MLYSCLLYLRDQGLSPFIQLSLIGWTIYPELIIKFIKFVGYKIKIQISIEYLYTVMNCLRIKLKNTIPFTVVSKKVKFSNAFNERSSNLYSEN